MQRSLFGPLYLDAPKRLSKRTPVTVVILFEKKKDIFQNLIRGMSILKPLPKRDRQTDFHKLIHKTKRCREQFSAQNMTLFASMCT